MENNQKNKISYYISVGGMTLTLEEYVTGFLLKNKNVEIRNMDFKYSPSDWNSGLTAEKPYKCFGIFKNGKNPFTGEDYSACLGIYEMYQSKMGLTSVYFFKDLQEYNSFKVSIEAPHFIKNEL